MSDINDNTCFEAARKCVYLYEFERILALLQILLMDNFKKELSS